jgi:hypothetical protein
LFRDISQEIIDMNVIGIAIDGLMFEMSVQELGSV